MKLFSAFALSFLVTSASASAAFAQLPDQVRQIQQAFRDKGLYAGPLDGVLNPEFRRAIWDFQKAKGLPRTARLDAPTIAALDLPATGAASPGAPSSFGAEGRSRANDVEAP